jgi:hypothetical protein
LYHRGVIDDELLYIYIPVTNPTELIASLHDGWVHEGYEADFQVAIHVGFHDGIQKYASPINHHAIAFFLRGNHLNSCYGCSNSMASYWDDCIYRFVGGGFVSGTRYLRAKRLDRAKRGGDGRITAV